MAIFLNIYYKYSNNGLMYFLPHSGNDRPATLQNHTYVYDICDWEWLEE
jgi:hypothetical protein